MFYFFGFLVIFFAFMVVTNKNPIYSLLSLICAFLATAGVMVLLHAELIAMLLLIIYVGAVAVLFLFVVMMLNIKVASSQEGLVKSWIFGILVAALLFSTLFIIIGKEPIAVSDLMAPILTVKHISKILFTEYQGTFLISGILLLAAMIAAIVLTLEHQTPTSLKRQNARKQIERIGKAKMVEVEFGRGVKWRQ